MGKLDCFSQIFLNFASFWKNSKDIKSNSKQYHQLTHCGLVTPHDQCWKFPQVRQSVPGRQIWRRTGNFLLIFLMFMIWDSSHEDLPVQLPRLSFKHCSWLHTSGPTLAQVIPWCQLDATEPLPAPMLTYHQMCYWDSSHEDLPVHLINTNSRPLGLIVTPTNSHFFQELLLNGTLSPRTLPRPRP